MLLECSHCGAPLDVSSGSRYIECGYCGTRTRARKLRTLSLETPEGFQPPERWRPPAQAAANSAVELKRKRTRTGLLILLFLLGPFILIAGFMVLVIGLIVVGAIIATITDSDSLDAADAADAADAGVEAGSAGVDGGAVTQRAPVAPLGADVTVEGTYTIAKGTDPRTGQAYGGRVVVSRSGEAFRLTWELPGAPPTEGVGVLVGQVLAVGRGTGVEHGVVAYALSSTEIEGRWAAAGAGPRRLGAETLKGPSPLGGTYTIARGLNPDGTSYAGNLSITPEGELYRLAWRTGESAYDGLGVKQGQVLGVGWGSGSAGVVVFKVEEHGLIGRSAVPGASSTGVEELRRDLR